MARIMNDTFFFFFLDFIQLYPCLKSTECQKKKMAWRLCMNWCILHKNAWLYLIWHMLFTKAVDYEFDCPIIMIWDNQSFSFSNIYHIDIDIQISCYTEFCFFSCFIWIPVEYLENRFPFFWFPSALKRGIRSPSFNGRHVFTFTDYSEVHFNP